MSELKYSITDLRDCGFPLQERLCHLAYQCILQNEFPPGPHSESPEIWIERLRQPNSNLHFFVAHIQNSLNPILDVDLYGVLIVETFPKSRVGLLTYGCVKPDYHNTGIMRKLILHAETHMKRLFDDSLLLAECNSTDQHQSEENYTRIKIIHRLGFQRLPIPYVQPPLQGYNEWVTDLWLMVYNHTQAIPAHRLATFHRELADSLGVSAPNVHDHLTRLCQSDTNITPTSLVARMHEGLNHETTQNGFD